MKRRSARRKFIGKPVTMKVTNRGHLKLHSVTTKVRSDTCASSNGACCLGVEFLLGSQPKGCGYEPRLTHNVAFGCPFYLGQTPSASS